MINRKGLRLSHLQLELESCEHVLGVLSNQIPNGRKSQEDIDREIGEYKAIRDVLLSEIAEEILLVGDSNG